jgi:hypothetical protein
MRIALVFITDNDFTFFIALTAPFVCPTGWIVDVKESRNRELNPARPPGVPIIFSIFPFLTGGVEVMGSH